MLYHPEQGSSHTNIFRYGCLYDLEAKVVATSSSSILEVLDDKSASTTLYPGSKLLILAHVQLKPTKPLALRHTRQNSDDLIEALELTLGTTTTEYLSIRLNYRHSAFPEQASPTERTQTTLTTTVTATIKRHNPASPWSSRPPQQNQSSTGPNPIFEIIASHWGPDAAANLSRRIYFPSPSKPLKSPVRPPRKPAQPLLPTLLIPKRKGSLRRCLRSPAVHVQDHHQHQHSSNIVDDEETERQNDRAKKIWSQIRRMSSVGGDNGDSDNEGDRTISSGSMRVSTANLKDDTDQQKRRARLRERALANRHSVGGEALRAFVPPSSAPVDTKENRPTTGMCGASGAGHGYEKEMGMRTGAAATSLSSRDGRDGENNRWGWSKWWQ